jgi:hypothetical protein
VGQRFGRKTVFVAAAMAIGLPAGLTMALTVPPLAASGAAVVDPVMCNVSGTATFSPPLTNSGTNTGKGSVETVTLQQFTESNCLSGSASGAPSSGSIGDTVIKVPATKVGAGKTAQYLTGYCPGFSSTASLKALKKISITTSWNGGEGGTTGIVTKKASEAFNSAGEGGFSIVAKYSSGSYPMKVVQLIVYLTTSETVTLAGGCSGTAVDSISFDGATSTVLQ